MAAGGPIEASASRASQASGSLLRNREFVLLWLGQFVSQFGDRLTLVALPWLIYEGTKSAFGTGLVFAIYTLPYVLFGTFAGVAIDRFNKRTLMIAADVVRAVLLTLVPVVAAWSTPLVLVLAFMVASAGVLFAPAKLAIVPDLVAPSRLMRANSVLAIGENVTEIAGYSVAGFLLVYVSTTTALRLDAVTFLISAAALAGIKYRNGQRSEKLGELHSVRREIAEGLGYLRHNRGLLVNTIMVCASAAGVGAAYPLSFFLSVEVLAEGTKAFGLFAGATGAGFLAGSLMLAAVANRVRKGWAMTLGLIVMGVSLAIVSMAQSTWEACVVFSIFGLANSFALIAIDTYLQNVVPVNLRGRVFGVRFTLTQGVYALSVIAAGALISVIDVRPLFVAAGLIITIPATIGLLVRDIRRA